MKIKRTTYFLITIVIIVWGLVTYKLLIGINSGKVTAEKKVTRPKESTVLVVDTLRVNYPDPFIKDKYFEKGVSKIKTNLNDPKKSMDTCKISFLGKINKGTKTFYLIKCKDSSYMLQIGERNFEGLKIINELRNNLIVEYKHSRYEISNNEE